MRALLLVALLASGCTTVPPAEAEGGARCDDSKTQALIGRTKSEKTGAEALRLSGARTLRWIAPGTAVTMDYREDRLNLHTNSAGKVIKAGCG